LCLLVIPVALITNTDAVFFITLLSELVLTCLCLVVSIVWGATAAGIYFVFGSLILGLSFTLFNPQGVDIRSLLLYALLAVVALIAGLVLPMWVIWVAAVVLIGATISGLLLSPLAPDLGRLNGDPLTFRLGALVLLVANQALAAVLGWMYARTARANIAGARRAIERERELTALKDQFLIAANHELRTPIMTWYNNIEILNLLGDKATTEQRDRLLTRALTSGKAVLRLLATVLDTGAIQSGPPQINAQPTALERVVRSVVETFDPRLVGEPGLEDIASQSRTITIEIPDDLWVMADEDRLRQVLINLLTNALKYSDAATPIAISARALALRGRARKSAASGAPTLPDIEVSVRDYGLGIPSRDMSKLFQRFVRLERDIAGPVRGTGVGLYLCRVLVEAMGGRIWVDSSGKPGEGSIFRFTLQGAPKQAEQATPTLPLATP
ncbi:MAG TPA: ATP-binding protein, partial [Ktedonobacterales bacterium]|nr:ATP-binding protein [Ktedonobacterales bacterium]